MGHLGERAQDAFLLGTEIDEHGDLFLDTDDPAETVHVVDDPVSYGEPLARWSDRGLEGAAGQMALGYPLTFCHWLQYAPAEPGTPCTDDKDQAIFATLADHGALTNAVAKVINLALR